MDALVGPHVDTALDITDLSFWYGKEQKLHDISLRIPKNKTTSIVGASGSGKSTLLRVFNRMYDLYPGLRATGEVLFEGKNILERSVDVNLLRSRIGMVFQQTTSFPMSVYENIAFGIGLYEKLSKADMDNRVESVLRRVGLWDEVKDALHKAGRSLSGGQQQRMCIARTVAIRPSIILMDESCSALDWRSVKKIEVLIAGLEQDHTIVVVTHNLSQARRISDYIAFMDEGRLVEFGLADNILTNAQQPLTREFFRGEFG